MIATITHSSANSALSALEDRPSAPSLRLSLAPVGSAPALLDGAWWPRSRDLGAELPSLTAVLDPLWGRITRVTVNPIHWSTVPRKAPVAGHVVKVGWFRAEQDAHELLLLSYHVGRWNLLVIPPQTPPASAARLMAAASDPRRTATASRLMEEEAALLLTGAENDDDRAVEAVWDSEGGHEAGTHAPRNQPTGR
ncbi:hypothetical protein ADK57_29135 [Streptomyces sp. MMG1533]|uniref:DUF5994 family protein n=1 Tax=Streptomyces sp. MMG1533 TaxID=1415546 RepID=UPI0003C9276D|nr:DUF5994 family protein [Streptomyces sp. MMG1533]AGZ94093.1 hypothetical protein [Streptomyces sp. MMG1533]KOU60799.1 hypothetical protein ADK57_29135 [Streptomyces sp. MMG1533]